MIYHHISKYSHDYHPLYTVWTLLRNIAEYSLNMMDYDYIQEPEPEHDMTTLEFLDKNIEIS